MLPAPDLFFTAFLITVSTSHLVVQTISSLSCRALVGRLFFRHYLVVTPSTSLGLSSYICSLARDCLLRDIPRIHPIC